MSLGNDGGEGGGGPLPGQHLVLDLPDLLLEVPGGGVDSLPDAVQSEVRIISLDQSELSITWGKTALSRPHLQHRGPPDLDIRNRKFFSKLKMDKHL